jgi:hypothetical protein
MSKKHVDTKRNLALVTLASTAAKEIAGLDLATVTDAAEKSHAVSQHLEMLNNFTDTLKVGLSLSTKERARKLREELDKLLLETKAEQNRLLQQQLAYIDDFIAEKAKKHEVVAEAKVKELKKLGFILGNTHKLDAEISVKVEPQVLVWRVGKVKDAIGKLVATDYSASEILDPEKVSGVDLKYVVTFSVNIKIEQEEGRTTNLTNFTLKGESGSLPADVKAKLFKVEADITKGVKKLQAITAKKVQASEILSEAYQSEMRDRVEINTKLESYGEATTKKVMATLASTADSIFEDLENLEGLDK